MMSDVMAKTFFTDLTSHIAMRAPRITLASHPIEAPPHLPLEQGRIDFLMMPRQYASSVHPMIELYREGFECLVDPNNPILEQGLTQKAYLAAAHVVIELGSARKTPADRAAIEQRYGPLRTGVKVYAQSHAPWMVKDTNWVATLPSSLAQKYATVLDLECVPLPIEVLPNVLVLQWGDYADQDACLGWLRQEIELYAADKFQVTP